MTLELRKPYLLFVGDATSGPYAKTARGVHDWAPEACLAQTGLPDCTVDLGLPRMSPTAAAEAGACSLLIGVAPLGGLLPLTWAPVLHEAVEAGLDVINGLHTPLATVPGLADAAQRCGVSLIDVRQPRQTFPVATGKRRSGKRLLTVGTDCSLGKKYTALALTKALRARGVDAHFRATGQTGILIAGTGVAIDAVVADFVAGAAESLSPAAPPHHWDVIEGQGSLFHPSYAGVTLGLLHGSQPDVLILCHDPTRQRIRSLPDFPMPPLTTAADLYLELAGLTNPQVRLAAVSLNTSSLNEVERASIIASVENEMGVPCFDPLKSPLEKVVDAVLV
jgi:uncharacterized NAD-dependent epimerase/dehydratase family protein